MKIEETEDAADKDDEEQALLRVLEKPIPRKQRRLSDLKSNALFKLLTKEPETLKDNDKEGSLTPEPVAQETKEEAEDQWPFGGKDTQGAQEEERLDQEIEEEAKLL